MSVIKVEEFLQEISPDAPCGEDLEYDSAFGEMERAAQGKAEQQFGDTLIPAEEPDWRDLKKKCLDLLSRTKDFRVVTYLAPAVLNTDGIPAFRDCLALLRGYVERYWETLYPQLDPEDDNDPTLRVNTLAALCDGDTVLRYLRKAPLVSSRSVGRFGFYDIEVANGELPPPPDVEPPGMSTIEAAFMDCDAEDLQANAAAVGEALEHVGTLEATVTEKVGAANAMSFEPLTRLLQQLEKCLSEQLARRGISDTSTEDAAEDGGELAAAGNGAATKQRLTGEITSREDVIRALEKICEYYDRYEPSSPLPLLLQRAKRLTNKTFLEIIRDLTPDALSQAEAIGGVADNEGE